MLLKNPYTKKCIDYPLDLSLDNIAGKYFIEHETFFCSWFTQWYVVHLYSGDVLYIPAGFRNNRDIYIVTYEYRAKEVQYPFGVYTLSYNNLLRESEFELSMLM